jgi:REP element-mobilizing transposase RayT
MPRSARLDAPGTLHHVMVRGMDGTPIFRDQSDREDFLEHLGQLVVSMQVRVSAWVLMDTHVHLLLNSGPAGLPGLMRHLLTGYAIRCNLRGKSLGGGVQILNCRMGQFPRPDYLRCTSLVQAISRRAICVATTFISWP